MALHDDIESTKKLWRTVTPSYKLILCISIFLSVSSVANLTSHLIAWKGFFKDTFEFMKEYIFLNVQNILQYFFNFFDVKLFEGFAELFIIFTLSISTFLRSVLFLKSKTKVDAFFQLSLIFLIGFVTIYTIINYLSHRNFLVKDHLLFLILLAYIFPVLSNFIIRFVRSFILYLLKRLDPESFETLLNTYPLHMSFSRYALLITLTFFTFGILASINKALF